MMRSILAGCILAALNAPAFASGGFSCSAESDKARVEVGGGVTRGMGGPVFSFTGEIDLFDKAVAEDLRKTFFEKEHLAQYWLDGTDLRLVLYREREADKPHGYVELTVLAKAGEEGAYDGTYTLTVFDGVSDSTPEGKTLTYEGKTECFVE